MNPRHNDPKQLDRRAHAPYNFVPLPERVVRADYEIPNHDEYTGHTGYLDCILTTLTPTYTRAAMSPQFFARWADEIRKMMEDDQAREEYAQFFHLDDAHRPVIPGSSLRGMVRALVEMAGFGKVKWVGDDLKITFRAVAAARDDPLKGPYEQVLGRFGQNVRAGYLLKKYDRWYVQPALQPGDLGWPGRDAYLKVKDRQIPAGAIPDLIRFDASDYRPQYHEVSFDVEIRKGKRGKYVTISQIGPVKAGYGYRGMLVCTGNMLETGKSDQPSRRKNYALVLARNRQVSPLKVGEQSIADYLAGLTSFQKEPPFDGQMGCLGEGRPIFYVEDGSEVIAFGHSPNFRISAWLNDTRRAATPLDFVPESLRQHVDDAGNEIIDIAEAIFGYVPEGKRSTSRAGRVYFTDAVCEPNQENVWLPEGVITPQILAGPKPTTFQHYLVQDKDKGHDPDNKRRLAHYGTPTPDETVIRGHKLYWHKQEGLTAADISEGESVNWSKDTQHTQIKPVNAGTTFRFRVYFESLTEVELGALLWALDLPEGHHHRIGMGKPLGLGSVAIEPRLVLSDRPARYRQLFDDSGWQTGEREESNPQQFRQAFEQYVLERMSHEERGNTRSLAEVTRIQMLLKMLEWPGPDSDTGYMDLTEFTDRPALPGPLYVEGKPAPVSGRRTGRVKWFNEQKGYGFIQVDESREKVFVHYSDIEGEGFRTLGENDRVEFSIEEAAKGPKAVGVRVIGG
jgi:CRISPR-associated protein (TIGR03986 family)